MRNHPNGAPMLRRASRLSLFALSLLAVPLVAPIGSEPVLLRAAHAAPQAEDGAALMKKAAQLEAAGKYEQAAETYDKAARAFEKAGKAQEQSDALHKSATMYEKVADQLIGGTKTPPAAAPPASPVTPRITAHTTTPRAAVGTPAPVPTHAVRLSPLAPRSGYIIGRAVTESGQPIPRFTVAYSGFEDGKLANYAPGGGAYDTINTSASGSGGRYAVKVPPGAYRVSAYVTYNYRGRAYNFALEPLNEPARHDYEGLGVDKLRGGLVRDFELKMTAKKKGASEETETVYKYAYYGGRIDLRADQSEGILGGGNRMTTPLRDAYPKNSQVEITLTPQGPMVDGTAGRPVQATLPLGDDGKYTFSIRGVYPGVYTATARLLKPDGSALPLRLSLQRARTILKGAGQYDKVVVDWQPSVTVDFLPNDVGPIPRFGVNAVNLYLGE